MKTCLPLTVPIPGYYAISGDLLLAHSKVSASVDNKFIHLLKAAFVKEIMNPLSGSHLAFGMLLVDSFLAASQFSFLISSLQLPDLVFNVHAGPPKTHLLSVKTDLVM